VGDHRISLNNPFSAVARQCAASRPHYPPDLLKFLASLSPVNGLSWDCATGNGQVALERTDYFDAVPATDVSSQLILL
jgi:hypothetical protein